MHVTITKASFDPVWEFTKTLPPYLFALNNFDPTMIAEYQELRAARSLDLCFLPEEDCGEMSLRNQLAGRCEKDS